MLVLNGRWCARVIRAGLCLAQLLLADAADGQSVYRCLDAAGKSAYQSEPCSLGARQREVKVPLTSSPPAAARPSQWTGYKSANEAFFTLSVCRSAGRRSTCKWRSRPMHAAA
jgi:hypothetical protein